MYFSETKESFKYRLVLKWSRSHLVPLIFWSPRGLGPKKFGTSMKIIIWHFHAETKFLWTKMNSGTKIYNGIRRKFPHASVHWYASTSLF